LTDLFDAILERGALARRDAPTTSKMAAASIDATRLENLVYETIYKFGPSGAISDQVQDALPDLSYSSVTARFKRLIDGGDLIVVGVRPGRSGRGQRVMVAKPWAS
jgi:hypothetical protein